MCLGEGMTIRYTIVKVAVVPVQMCSKVFKYASGWQKNQEYKVDAEY